ncbi:uncharacterized protein LOC126724156 [Quercus robur]|uniref:uncharacterized protein LOC126724156 n=1 Tax=Quercus robur TaxID=38942 RepID=UPI00216126B1|nr:uncharacterized protein LOC126724156 [Quercus robur]
MNSTRCATDTRMAAGLPESEEEEEMQRQTYTYWCHECDMSVNLISLSLSHSQCPHCNSSDFLELMDSTIATTTTQQQDSYFLDNPTLLHRLFLLHHNEEDNINNNNHVDSSSLSTITISSSMLDSDPVLLCAICKDDLLLHSQAKQLPCSHLYHSQCILPWLSSHNSCPLCRFQLPTTTTAAAAATTGTLSFLDFLHDEVEQEQDWLGFTNTLRHIARRQTMVAAAAASGDQHLGLNDNDHNAHIILP